ncbi:hypothetical protein [Streptomyces resistomycificus]|uniref:Uncharacterized protein n=1 Tax=Streptomyces resistomycificus TaxID=67356 RepID=A0A0L8L558_9ACTN|nr:hypothetical protein [Streptomyces resistomycificus]KOG33287.1 hypothetical protein ADK37_23150 [Streptomyces resistomycificus]KUN99487.1 hypothetical protein AQJ84_11100 [Streptomyces resistomycificus]
MPQITLAHWYGDKAPGETIDVDEVTAKALRRDGLVAQPERETLQEEQAPAPVAENPAQPENAVDAGHEAAQPGRRKR